MAILWVRTETSTWWSTFVNLSHDHKIVLHVWVSVCSRAVGAEGAWGPQKGLQLPKRSTILPSDSSGSPGEKGRSCIRRKKWECHIFYFYLFSLFQYFTTHLHNSKLMTLTPRGSLWTFSASLAVCATPRPARSPPEVAMFKRKDPQLRWAKN